jgi:hypothetical protein
MNAIPKRHALNFFANPKKHALNIFANPKRHALNLKNADCVCMCIRFFIELKKE